MTGRNCNSKTHSARGLVSNGLGRHDLLRCLALTLTLAVAVDFCLPDKAFAGNSDAEGPSGTLLLPLTPKIDITPSERTTSGTTPAARSSSGKAADLPDADIKTVAPDDSLENGPPLRPNSITETAPDKFSLEVDVEDDPIMEEGINEDVTLQGTIQIVADDTEYDQEQNTFLGTGNAVAIIGGQNSKLEADMILYDQNSEMIDARGNVRITRNGQVTTGSAFKFNVNKDEYLITNPDTEVNGSTIIARKGFGKDGSVAFRKGTLTLPEPIYMQRNTLFGPIGYAAEVREKLAHPDAYLPTKPSFKFKARKITYEKYNPAGNLTVFGGRLQFGSFGVPVPKFTANVNKGENTVMFPITANITNNLQIGGMHLGPKFSNPVGKSSILSWSPMLQLGGRNLDGTRSEGSRIGLSGRVGFENKRMRFNLGAGSVNHLMVGELHYNVAKNLRLQSGINRFLDDGMYGFRRARLAAELVDVRSVNNVPFLSGLRFRTSLGGYQDNPQLLNLNPEYARLFGGAANRTIMNTGIKLQEQVSAMSHPIINIGDDSLGIKSFLFGGVAMRGYSTGDRGMLGQVGPMVDVRMKRVRLQGMYAKSVTRGSTPFVFDQFIQGQRSCSLFGDYKVSKYLTLGGGLGYNLNNKLFYQKSVSAAIGPEDFKVLLTRDLVRGMNRFGFDVLYGAPVPFDKLVLKGNPDHGQLGGI